MMLFTKAVKDVGADLWPRVVIPEIHLKNLPKISKEVETYIFFISQTLNKDKLKNRFQFSDGPKSYIFSVKLKGRATPVRGTSSTPSRLLN